jgi:ABC-type lipoprotein release transport system permease subunit
LSLPLYIARRYLFAKKSHNAINIISLVAVCGIIVATMATVCVLSVFNGFSGLVANWFSAFDPELKIAPVKGKTFDPKTDLFLEVFSLPDVEIVTENLEDNVVVKFRERYVPATLKGVSNNFSAQTGIDSIMLDGESKLKDEINNFALFGLGLAHNLGISAGFVSPVELIAPKRNVSVNVANPMSSLNTEYAFIGGIFQVEQEIYDDNYVIVPIELARALLDYETEVSALELKLKAGANIGKVQNRIQKIIGPDFSVKDRYQQQEDTFKMMNGEKWFSFVLLCFILLITVFNIVGSLSILIVEKQADVLALRNMGANNQLILRIFVFEGWLISAVGTVIGIVSGCLLCLGQQHFGWLKLGTGGNFAVNAYPVVVQTGDLAFVLLTALLIEFLSVLYPVWYFSKKFTTS